MKRLQTFYALLASIFAAAASVITLFVSYALDVADPLVVIWIAIAGATGAFILSLIIGHYLAEPLTMLHRKADALLHGDTSVTIEPEGRLYEADVLAEDIAALSEQAKSQMADLSVQQRRQTQFISDVAHELRTPLTAIRGNAETLMDADMPQALRERFCQTIIDESERLARLSNDLLTLQHIEEGTEQTLLERVNLHTIAERVVDALGPMIEDQGAQIILEGEAPDVLGNPDRLQQVIYNLVANASRFVGEGGHVTVRLEGLSDRSVISVIDDGPGFGNIDPKLLFTRFYRGDNSRARSTGGTGLGLSIVKGIVDAHDGTVEAFNAANGGACFIVALPSIQEHIH